MNVCSSKEELAVLKGTDKGKISESNIFILAPFMIKSLINAKTSEPFKLIPIVIDAATNFGEESNDGSQLAIEHAEALANLLGSMRKGKVPQFKFVLCPVDKVLQKYTKDRKKQCLHRKARHDYWVVVIL